jgi:hypothetical protein
MKRYAIARVDGTGRRAQLVNGLDAPGWFNLDVLRQPYDVVLLVYYPDDQYAGVIDVEQITDVFTKEDDV